MGAWGIELYDNDDALDIRAEFESLWKRGIGGESAIDQLKNRFLSGEPAAEGLFWLVIAECQWSCGVLRDDVKARAITFVNEGGDSADYENDAPRRLEVLESVKAKLLKPQPKPKKLPTNVKADFIERTEFQAGDVIAFRLPSGTHAALWTVDTLELEGELLPVFQLLEWKCSRLPLAAEVAALKPLRVGEVWAQDVDDPQYMIDTGQDFDSAKAKGLVPTGMSELQYFEALNAPLFPVRRSGHHDASFRQATRLDTKLPCHGLLLKQPLPAPLEWKDLPDFLREHFELE